MADESQLKILRQGPDAWNAWREQMESIDPDFFESGLSGPDFSGADLSGAWLVAADLSGADLSGADLSGADLSGADLKGASLSAASLHGACLNRADLSGTWLCGANLTETNLIDAHLDGADLREAVLEETVFGDVDLGQCRGLELIEHRGPSSIDIRTLQRSGPLPLVFLRGVGLPDTLIEYLPSLPNQPIQHYSCFISYSAKDDEFVHRLHADLQDKSVRCWFAPEDMKIGAKIPDPLDQAIRLRDKVLLVLSEASIESEWVEDEVTKGFAEERQRGIIVRIDDAVFATDEAWAIKLRDNRNIGDFRGWKDHDAYQRTLARLLRDLRVESA
jgi:uncharacterized protein YjbI with pentapeptide repeats